MPKGSCFVDRDVDKCIALMHRNTSLGSYGFYFIRHIRMMASDDLIVK